MNTKHSHSHWVFIIVALLGNLAAFQSSAVAQSFSFPTRPTTHVCDDASLFSHSAEASLDDFLNAVDQQCDVEFLVVTIQHLPEHRANRLKKRKVAKIAPYARAMFDEYRIGHMPANRGILLVIARDNRECRVELGAGYGHEFDSVASKIIDQEIVPAFRDGRYEQGIQQGTSAIARSIAGFDLPDQQQERSNISIEFWIGLAIIVASSLLIVVSILISRKRGWGWVVVGLAYIQYLRFRNALSPMQDFGFDSGTKRQVEGRS